MTAPPIPPIDDAAVISVSHWFVGLFGGLGGFLSAVAFGAFRVGRMLQRIESFEKATDERLDIMDAKISEHHDEQVMQHRENRADRAEDHVELETIKSDLHTIKTSMQSLPYAIAQQVSQTLNERIDRLWERVHNPRA